MKPANEFHTMFWFEGGAVKRKRKKKTFCSKNSLYPARGMGYESERKGKKEIPFDIFFFLILFWFS